MALAKIQARVSPVTSPFADNDNPGPRGCKWSLVLAQLDKHWPTLLVPAWGFRRSGWTADQFIDFLNDELWARWPDTMALAYGDRVR